MFISGIHGSFATKWKQKQNCSEREGFGTSGEKNATIWKLFFDKDGILFFHTYIMNNSQQQIFFMFLKIRGMLLFYVFLS